MPMIKKYDTVQRDVYRYIWNRLTTCGNLNEEVVAIELIQKFPTWIMFSNANRDTQKDLALALIRQAKFYRSEVFKAEESGVEICEIIAESVAESA
jgi:hypothetical protein